MNRGAAALLVAVAIGAGTWMAWRPAVDAPPPEPGTDACRTGAPTSCEAPARDPAPASIGSAPRTRRPAEAGGPPASTSTEQAPGEVAAEGERLREEADRLLAAGRVLEAVDAMRRAAEVDPSARNHGDLGAILERLTAFEEAARHLKLAAELDPSNADRWLALANVYYRAIEPGEAWKAERRAKEAEPGIELRRDAGGRLVRKAEAQASGARQP